MKKPVTLVKTRTYWYIFITTLVMAGAFVAVANFTAITAAVKAMRVENDPVIQANTELLLEEFENYSGVSVPELDGSDDKITAVIGKAEDELTYMATTQLNGMKEQNIQRNTVEELTVDEIAAIDVIIVADADISLQDIELIENLTTEGKDVIFLTLPSSHLLMDTRVQDLLGIKDYLGDENYENLRLSKMMTYDKIIEQEEVEFTAATIQVQQGVRVLASATFEEDTIDNEELPHIMWTQIVGEGSVYVCNGDLFHGEFGYGMISSIYCDMEARYIYPVVNAYVCVVEGAPYTTNFTSQVLENLYTRDAILVQNDLFFPEIIGNQSQHGVNATWYTPQYDAFMDPENDEVEFYVQSIATAEGEIGRQDGDELITENTIKSYASEWNVWFDYYREDEKAVNIPLLITADNYEEKVIDTIGSTKSMGYLSIYVDIDKYIYAETADDEEVNLVNFFKEFETALGVHKEEYSWIERVTVDEAAKRLATYLVMEPIYTYEEDAVKIQIEHFTGEAYFIMKSIDPIEEAEHAEFTEIGEDLYLISISNEEAMVYFDTEASKNILQEVR